MLWHVSAINGYAIEASDGDIGTVSDFLFDDASWRVRWLVVDTGNWLSGRKVLLPPSVLGRIYAKDRVFAVKLTKQQVKDSPGIDTETSVYDY
jgi:PRC-barrel domain